MTDREKSAAKGALSKMTGVTEKQYVETAGGRPPSCRILEETASEK